MTILSSLVICYLFENLFSFIKYFFSVVKNFYSQIASKTVNVWHILYWVILNFDMVCRAWIIFRHKDRCLTFIGTIFFTLNCSCCVLKLFSWFWQTYLYFSLNRGRPNQFFLWYLSLKRCRRRALKFTDKKIFARKLLVLFWWLILCFRIEKMLFYISFQLFFLLLNYLQ